jgi:hypothetical protein
MDTDPFETRANANMTCNPGVQGVSWHGVSPLFWL